LIRALACFGAAAEGLLAEKAELGFEFGDALAEGILALAGAGLHSLPVADLLAEGESFGLPGAGVAGSGADGRREVVRQPRRAVNVPAGGRQK
jgi:hypothetical protein